ncbi:hypothetical protein ACTXT7_001597 [Hymenolepis weldensis]
MFKFSGPMCPKYTSIINERTIKLVGNFKASKSLYLYIVPKKSKFENISKKINIRGIQIL